MIILSKIIFSEKSLSVHMSVTLRLRPLHVPPKVTRSEFQKPRQTAAAQDEAELRILNFKTIWHYGYDGYKNSI